jgi:hypothetical protein
MEQTATKVVEISLPLLPLNSLALSDSESIQFLKRLHDSLKPLTEYQFPQGGQALVFNLRDSDTTSMFVADEQFGRGANDPGDNHRSRGWWVLSICMIDPADSGNHLDSVQLYSMDFCQDAPKVRAAFRRAFMHLQIHVTTPLDLPEKLKRALAALQ